MDMTRKDIKNTAASVMHRKNMMFVPRSSSIGINSYLGGIGSIFTGHTWSIVSLL